jgi:hypothetical protein
MKTQHFNIIRKAITNPANKEIHLPQLEKMVKNYGEIFGKGNLYKSLEVIYLSESTRINFNLK